MKTFDFIIHCWNIIAIISFCGTILGFILYFFIRNNTDIENPKLYNRIGVILALQLVATFIILFVLHGVFSATVRKELSRVLSGNYYELYVKDKNITNEEKKELVSKLCNLFDHLSNNHSSPNRYIKVIIKNNSDDFYLSLGRDNQDTTLYWVFVDNYRATALNDIGKIRTKIFNK